MNFDFVGIGDIVVDSFIELAQATVNDTPNGKTITMPFADKIPFKSEKIVSGVGNSANACVSAARLGLKTAFFGIIGTDHYGELCKSVLDREAITPFLEYSTLQTNHHIVLSYQAERTILVNHQAYDYSKLLAQLSTLTIKTLYISSLSPDASILYPGILEYCTSHPETYLVFQPGTFQLKNSQDPTIKELYKRCNLLVVNKEEAELVTTMPHNTPINLLAKKLHEIGPDTLAITDGPAGSYLSHMSEIFYLPQYPDIAPPIERTGAGDAFASTLASYITKGFKPLDALMRAPINSMNVVQHTGAQVGLLTSEAIENYLAHAPTTYKIQKV
ncbi:MAG TPA: carbohydrate kinase family protein [Candidatus Paceibacterota bacterium]